MAVFLALGPAAIGAARRRGRIRRLALGALGSMLIAEAGRRRAGGAEAFPRAGSLLAPLWLVERSLCSWLALGARLRGGVLYGGRRLPAPRLPCDACAGVTSAPSSGSAGPLSARKPIAL